ncbi:MAG TPA: glycosyltransferase [Candidatus Hodarchaeales archaeon]|uniref:Uncharacterized protein n=1 Tax=Candidatus Chisholmbacteria bacterium RIFCSPHIGHO2_01_FULL_49_18 TaxID=1797590 RepID=A0A1G1VLD0_9BACT|nr:MAG: hypothetical protein A2785_02660 [Candidatus Chisholmbacteria bacterium RIFCSPHIGHO2_01_FULL_49_18]HKZ42284.1 glycosyltransferase [Candidatus Hodarchaeales archaeon]
MHRKKLMILIWNMGVGGIQKQVRDIVVKIEKYFPRWEVHLVIKQRKRHQYFADEISRSTNTTLYYFTSSSQTSKSWRSTLWIFHCFWKIKPDVCLTFLDHLSVIVVLMRLLCFWRTTKIALNEEVVTSTYLKLNRARPWFWKLLILVFYRWADIILVPSDACKQDLINHFHLGGNSIQVIHNWTLLPAVSFGPRPYDLIYAGRYEREKNILAIPPIIELVRSHKPQVQALIIGEGSMQRMLQQEILRRQLQGNVTLLPPQRNIAQYLSKGKVLILPTMNEGLPNIILEAAMCGMPTVCYSFAGVSEVVKDGKTGFVVNHTQAAASRVLCLLSDMKRLHAMRSRAQAFVGQHFGPSNQDQYLDFLLNGNE